MRLILIFSIIASVLSVTFGSSCLWYDSNGFVKLRLTKSCYLSKTEVRDGETYYLCCDDMDGVYKSAAEGKTSGSKVEPEYFSAISAPKSAPVSAPRPAPVSVPKPAPISVPKPAPISVPKPAPISVPKPAPISVPKPAPISVPKPAPISVPKPAPISVPKPAPISVPKPAPISVPKPAPVPQPKPAPVSVPKPAPVPQPKPAPVPQPKPAPVPQPKPAPVPQPKPAPVPQPKPAPNPQPKPAPNPQPKPAPNPQPKPAPNPQPKPAPNPQPKPAPNPQPKPAPNPQPKPAPNPQPKPAPSPQPKPAPNPQPKPAPNPQPKPAPNPQPATTNNHAISENGMNFLKNVECNKGAKCLSIYKDSAGIDTIGYGHACHVDPQKCAQYRGKTLTQGEADNLLRTDMQKYANMVNKLVKVPLTPDQFSALVSFQYNTGGLSGSTLLKKLNAGDYNGAAEQFKSWNKQTVNGKKEEVKGLTNRRREECNLFMSGNSNGKSAQCG